ncbi:MAG: hypothetical protein K940chlam2_00013 [Chlamydiae bacterium]|nr:hypothetical protein [Chlamydiota bacterium]
MGKRKRGRRAPAQGQQVGGRKQLKAKKNGLLDIAMSVYGEWDMAIKAVEHVPAALEGMNEQYRMIVVDNGTPEFITGPEGEQQSSVSPVQQAQAIRSTLRQQDSFFRLEENTGYPGGMNTAVSKGANPLILILTADVYLDPDAITKMVREMDDPSVGVVAPMLLFPLDESPHGPPGGVQSAGIAFDIRGDPFHIFIGWTPEHPKVNKKRDMQAVTGACFMTRRSLWQQIGGFWPGYGAGTFEDMEYCFAVRQLGSRILFAPEARGSHYVGGSIVKGAGKSGFPLTHNAATFKGRWVNTLVWDAYRYY